MTAQFSSAPIQLAERPSIERSLAAKARRNHRHSAALLAKLQAGETMQEWECRLARTIAHEEQNCLKYKGGTLTPLDPRKQPAPAPVAAVPAEGMDLGETLSDKLRQKLCAASVPGSVELLQASLKDALVRKRIAALAQSNGIGLTDYEVFAAVDQSREYARLASSGLDDDE